MSEQEIKDQLNVIREMQSTTYDTTFNRLGVVEGKVDEILERVKKLGEKKEGESGSSSPF